MSWPRITFRARLTAAFLLLFVALGGALVVVNYQVLDSQLPQQVGGSVSVSSDSGGVVTGSALVDPGADNASSSATAELDSAIHHYRSDALARLVRVSSWSLVGGTALAALLAWLVARRALRPLHQMNEAAHRISEENLSERLPVSGPRDELRDLAENLNASLSRLEAAFTHERRLIANASHELGTPIANQRAVLEVALADPDLSREELLEACQAALGQTRRSEALLDGMLALARADQGQVRVVPLPLDEIVAATIEQLAPLDVDVTCDLPPMSVPGDRFLVERLVANLVGNAVGHNVPGGWVRVAWGTHGVDAVTITNSCALLTADQLEGLREPFRRGAQDRVGSPTGSGLGLAIADSVARAHGWRIDLSAPEPGVFCATVDLAPSDL